MAVMTPADDVARLAAEVAHGVEQAHQLVAAVVAGADVTLAMLPGPLADGAPAGAAELARLTSEVLGDTAQLLALAGDPTTLRSAGAVWSGGVGAVAGRLAGLATLSATQADDRWTGVAADAYRNSLAPQQAALAAVKAASDEIDAALADVGAAILRFWTAVAADCITLVTALTAASATAGTVIGAPAGIAGAAAALVAFAAAMVGTVSALTDITTDATTRAAALERRVSNDVAFPGGAWPRSTTDMSDGSLIDGDDTDWHLR